MMSMTSFYNYNAYPTHYERSGMDTVVTGEVLMDAMPLINPSEFLPTRGVCISALD